MVETILIICIFVLMTAVCVLYLKLHTARKTMKEIDEGLHEKLDMDTNTPISISGIDLYSRKLASDLNREIVKLKKEQHRYSSKNNDIKDAVTNIAHDIRTPLTAINGYLELFEKAELTDEEKRWLSIIRERTNVLAELVEELFSYSLAYSEAEELKLENVNLNDELANVLVGFYGAIKKENIEPQIDIPEESVYRMIDKKAFGSIISNLMSNALKYSSGDLKISMDSLGTITFSNKAAEMAPNDVAKLFDRFYTVQTAKGSTGLGLSIAHMLTEKMNGEMEAYLEKGNLIIKLRIN